MGKRPQGNLRMVFAHFPTPQHLLSLSSTFIQVPLASPRPSLKGQQGAGAPIKAYGFFQATGQSLLLFPKLLVIQQPSMEPSHLADLGPEH